MVSDNLKTKVLDLIKEQSKTLGINIRVTARIKDYSVLKVNIQSCSIDLKQNLIETVKDKLENGRLIGTDREYLQNVLNTIEQESETPQHIPFSLHKLNIMFSGKALELLEKVHAAIRCDYYNHSEVYQDYFDVAYYYDLSIGNNKAGFKVI